MKRLVGRLKIQEPSNDITIDILQSIRIETDLRAERSVAARFNQFAETLRSIVVFPRALGLGFGVAAIAAILYTQSISGNQVQMVGAWDHSVPAASEFTSGVGYPDTNRFISPTIRGASGGGSMETVSFGSGIQDFRQSPPQFGACNGYFTSSR
jgi:hypothetical protein